MGDAYNKLRQRATITALLNKQLDEQEFMPLYYDVESAVSPKLSKLAEKLSFKFNAEQMVTLHNIIFDEIEEAAEKAAEEAYTGHSNDFVIKLIREIIHNINKAYTQGKGNCTIAMDNSLELGRVIQKKEYIYIGTGIPCPM